MVPDPLPRIGGAPPDLPAASFPTNNFAHPPRSVRGFEQIAFARSTLVQPTVASK